ncbi:MAG: hypothetical protein KDC67_06870 [Ignavibacteriae bacterium]|nr:hypothetical protein [Ignavibacteriota bacterium]
MEKILKLYSELLQVYTEQIKHFEQVKESNKRIQWNPVSVLNSRMFIYDEYLLNPYHGRFCFEEKNAVMPYLEEFIAHYELLVPEQKIEFEAQKYKNGYYLSLDALINDSIPIIDFLKSQLVELERQRLNCNKPFPPKRKNANRQKAKYLEDKKEYEGQMRSLQNCFEEVQSRIARIENIRITVEK